MLTAFIGRLPGRICLLLPILFCLSQPAHAEAERYNGVLRGNHLSPPIETSGLGSVQLAVAGDVLSWIVSFYDLESPPVAVQMHGPAAPGESAPVQLDLGNQWGDLGRNNIMAGKTVLQKEQLQSLASGKWYLVVRTEAHPEGELRAPLERFN